MEEAMEVAMEAMEVGYLNFLKKARLHCLLSIEKTNISLSIF
jgi:hypothetical protein